MCMQEVNRTSSSFWAQRPVFVTGATGLLGSWLVPELVRAGASVVALIRDNNPRSPLIRGGWLGRITSVQGSLTDEGLLQRTLAEYSIDTIFHLGAQTLVGVAKVDPVGTLDANIRGTWLLLEAARMCGVKQVIVASSDKAYGDCPDLPYREDYPLRGRYPYDVSKSCADLITSMYATTFGMQSSIVRCGNLFGGGDLNFSRLVPGAIQSTLRGESFLIRSDGLYVRDFLYVEDAVQAYLCLAERLANDASLSGEAFNFGLELKVTMLDVVQKILVMMGRSELRPTVLDIANKEIREQSLDAEKARTRLGWSPQYYMDEGLRRTIDWYQNFFAGEEGVRSQTLASAGS